MAATFSPVREAPSRRRRSVDEYLQDDKWLRSYIKKVMEEKSTSKPGVSGVRKSTEEPDRRRSMKGSRHRRTSWVGVVSMKAPTGSRIHDNVRVTSSQGNAHMNISSPWSTSKHETRSSTAVGDCQFGNHHVPISQSMSYHNKDLRKRATSRNGEVQASEACGDKVCAQKQWVEGHRLIKGLEVNQHVFGDSKADSEHAPSGGISPGKDDCPKSKSLLRKCLNKLVKTTSLSSSQIFGL